MTLGNPENAKLLTWEQVGNLTGDAFSESQWEAELETYHLWLERTPCGEFPTVIEGARGIYRITSAGHESIGCFTDPHTAEAYAFFCYGDAWEDEGRQLMPYEILKPSSGR